MTTTNKKVTYAAWYFIVSPLIDLCDLIKAKTGIKIISYSLSVRVTAAAMIINHCIEA